MKNIKLPVIQNANMLAVAKVMQSIASALSDAKNTKSFKFSLQQITNDGQIRTYGAKLLKSGSQVVSEFVIPYCKDAKEYKPIMLEFLKQGFSQKRISEILNVSPSTVSRILKGK